MKKLRLTPEELDRAHDGMCGVSIGDGECSCLVHWIDGHQKELRGYEIMIRHMGVALKSALAYNQAAFEDVIRVSGESLCSCSLPYHRHPEIMPTFHMDCAGRIVKT